jgi:acetyl-CoA carboxylase biotin carboxyl carrier protein
MTQIDSELVKQLAGILNDTGLTEIEYDTGGVRIRVARAAAQMMVAPAAVAAAPVAAAPAAAAAAPVSDPASHPGAIKAPMVGVVYLSPEPGAPAFAKIGDTVSEGQTLFLIEAMKTFNPVKATRSGKLVQVLVENTAPVEYGEALAIIE